jgi:hypothetical protein
VKTTIAPAGNSAGGSLSFDDCFPLFVLLRKEHPEAPSTALQTHLETPEPFLRYHILSKGVDLEILGELAPGAFHYGMTCVVEFEPHSLWHEVSLSIAAGALKRGIKTEYHVFQYAPQEIRTALKGLGVDVDECERRGTFRIMDTYTPTTPLKRSAEGRAEPMLSGTVPDADRWGKTIRAKLERGFGEDEKRWLHIDDNEAVLLQFSDEEYVANGWRTTFVPMAKARELLVLHALLTGVASESFYRKREAVADAVIDVRAVEEGRKLEHYIRLRVLRGAKFDSSWRRIELFGANSARLSSGKQVFGFQSEDSEKIFNYLLKSFVDDHFVEKHTAETSGWRSLVEIARGIGASGTSLYTATGTASLKELSRRGVIERRVLSKQRGRGGRVTRTRIAYEKGFVKEYVNRYVEN